jgi:hypothetical protein
MPECRRAPSLPRRLPKEVPKVIQTLLAPSVRVPRKGSGLTGPCWTQGIFSDCFDTFYGFVDQDLRLKCHPFPFPRSVTNAIVSLPGPCWHEATKPFHHLFSVPHEFFFSHQTFLQFSKTFIPLGQETSDTDTSNMHCHSFSTTSSMDSCVFLRQVNYREPPSYSLNDNCSCHRRHETIRLLELSRSDPPSPMPYPPNPPPSPANRPVELHMH